MSYKFKYGTKTIEVPQKSDITWNNVLNKPSTFNPMNHNHNYATWIGKQFMSGGEWIGFYNAIGGGTRKGWIGHDGGTDFIFSNEAKGIFSYNTSIDINGWIYPQEIKCMAGNEITYNTTNNEMWFNFRKSGSGGYINTFRFGDSRNGGYGTVIAKVSNPSDRKLKKDITKIFKAKEFILGLNPIEYTYKDGKRRNMGFVAQEVSQLCHNLAMGDMSLYKADVIGEIDESGKPKLLYFDEIVEDDKLSWTLDYSQCVAPLVETVQEQQKEIDNLKQHVNEIESLLLSLKES